MAGFSFERPDRKRVVVRRAGQWVGSLELRSHRANAGTLNSRVVTWWEGRVCGVDLRATTLPKLKRAILALPERG